MGSWVEIARGFVGSSKLLVGPWVEKSSWVRKIHVGPKFPVGPNIPRGSKISFKHILMQIMLTMSLFQAILVPFLLYGQLQAKLLNFLAIFRPGPLAVILRGFGIAPLFPNDP